MIRVVYNDREYLGTYKCIDRVSYFICSHYNRVGDLLYLYNGYDVKCIGLCHIIDIKEL